MKWYNSLRVQIVLLLTLALLPLGAVAIYQTNRVEGAANRNAELALLAVTSRAAKSEELIIESAFGAARFFASVAGDFIDNPARCTRDLTRFLTENDTYNFIGILPVSGVMTCSSSGGTYDFSDWPDFSEIVAAQEATIVVDQPPFLSGNSVFVMSEPYRIDGAFAGFVTISIPHDGLPETTDDVAEMGLQELITFNGRGELLTSRTGLDVAAQELPMTRTLQDLKDVEATAFAGQNQRGELRTYTVVPIEGTPGTIIGVWRVENGLASRLSRYIKPATFPILMWIASMAVAMLSIYTLVLRHINRLRRNMEEFAATRSMKTARKPTVMPNELQALVNNFDAMTDNLVREEAQLENLVREKNVLIKEVHHRVKNNLQLISSIMNMQIRTAEQAETKTILRRLQDRVLSLATIHRDLYQSQYGGMVDVGALVAEIVEKTVEVGVLQDDPISIHTDFDQVLLYPDQAVPLSLLSAESMTNAMKYIGAQGEKGSFIRVSLKQIETDCVLTLANSIGDTPSGESTGLGAQLINAFAIQLGGTIDLDQTADSYTMTLRFKIEDFAPDTQDF